MIRRNMLRMLPVFLAAMAIQGSEAQVSVPVTASTAASEMYPEVTCTSANAGMNADILQLANDTRDQLGQLLQLGGKWRFPVHVTIVTPDDPLADKIHEERIGVAVMDKTMRIDATLPSGDPALKAFVQRQFVTALLWEKFFAKTSSFNARTRLDVVPLWLVEGLNEWLLEDSGHDREAVVRRAALADRAPTLAEINDWAEISDDRLLGLYQRAFCYYLVNSLIHQETKRAVFQQWLATVATSGPSSGKYLFPTEAGWKEQLLQAPARSHDLIYTWDESASALSATETIAIAEKKADDTRICTLDTVAAFPPDKELTAALQKKIFDLTALELRAHPSWRPILALYRFGLAALIGGHSDQAQKLIEEARKQRTNEIAYHQKLTDYVNWFEVTKDFSDHKSAFEPYFQTARETEQVQADPEHPNAIRAGLIKVESQF